MNTSPKTTRYGLLAATGTGVAALGGVLAAGTSSTPAAPSWLPNDVTDEAAGAKPPEAP